MKTALLFHNKLKPQSLPWVKRIRTLLRRRGVKVLDENAASSRADFAVAVGGDGTMLRAARVLSPYGVPVAGINTGGLGFLSGTEAHEAERDIAKIVRGSFPIQKRQMLSVEGFRAGRRLFGPILALNDCVLRPKDHARAFDLKAFLGEDFLTHYFGDGLIVSTPTGSTAYALAAMGPIVEPGLDVLLLAPICPHALTLRPLIVPFDRPLTVRVRARRPGEAVEALASMDGQVNRVLRSGDEVSVRRHDKPFLLMVNPRRDYFDVLRAKLQWGADFRPPRGRRA